MKGQKDVAERVMHFDIQRENELFEGWQDNEFSQGKDNMIIGDTFYMTGGSGTIIFGH